jgi:hypothetical protein
MSVSASSGAPLAAVAAVLPTLEDVRGWVALRVKQWAMTVGLDDDDAGILAKQKIDGTALLDVVTEEKLIKMYDMPGGPAGKLMNAVAAIKKAGGSAPTDGGAGGAGAGAFGWRRGGGGIAVCVRVWRVCGGWSAGAERGGRSGRPSMMCCLLAQRL